MAETMNADVTVPDEHGTINGATYFDILTDFDNLYRAHQSCRKGKKWKDSVAIYDIRGLECTYFIQQLLINGTYKMSEYNCFTINERGKKREIKSIKYHDRVAQKCLMDNIITPLMSPKLISGNGASQKGKGTDYAIKRFKEQLGRQWRKGGGYILMCDMKGYFDSIPHDMLNEMYSKVINDERVMQLIMDIHASIPGGRGVPLGNQLSQMDALLALSPLDHFIKEQLHIEGYGRYMDDFYLIHESREYLINALNYIKSYMEARGMKLNGKKTKLIPLSHGIDFLGFRYHLTDSGKVVMKLSKRSVRHHKQKLHKMAKLWKDGKITYKACEEAHRCWKAHAKRGDTYYLIRKMDTLFKELFTQNKKEES